MRNRTRITFVRTAAAAALAVPALLASAGSSPGKAASKMDEIYTPSSPAEARLAALLPATIGTWKRHGIAQSALTLGPKPPPTWTVQYRRDDRIATVEVSDLTAAPPAGWTGNPSEQTTPDGIVRLYREGDRSLRELTARSGQPNNVTMTLPNGVIVGAQGLAVPVADLKFVVLGVDLAKAAALKPL